jgi:hexosaminidase
MMPFFDEMTPLRTGTMATVAIDPSFRAEQFAVRYVGLFEVTTTGVTRIIARADDGVRVFVDAELVVQDDRVHAVRDAIGEIALGAGAHQMRVEYFQGTGGKALSIAVESIDR